MPLAGRVNSLSCITLVDQPRDNLGSVTASLTTEAVGSDPMAANPLWILSSASYH